MRQPMVTNVSSEKTALAPWQHLGIDGCKRLGELAAPLARTVIGSQGFVGVRTPYLTPSHEVRPGSVALPLDIGGEAGLAGTSERLSHPC